MFSPTLESQNSLLLESQDETQLFLGYLKDEEHDSSMRIVDFFSKMGKNVIFHYRSIVLLLQQALWTSHDKLKKRKLFVCNSLMKLTQE